MPRISGKSCRQTNYFFNTAGIVHQFHKTQCTVSKQSNHAPCTSLIQADISSVLNNHIFSFSRFFEGPGPAPAPVLQPRAQGTVSLAEVSKTEIQVEKERGQEKSSKFAGGRELFTMPRALKEGLQTRTGLTEAQRGQALPPHLARARDGARSSMGRTTDVDKELGVAKLPAMNGQQARASSSLGMASGLGVFEGGGVGGGREQERAKREKVTKHGPLPENYSFLSPQIRGAIYSNSHRQYKETNQVFDKLLNMTTRDDVNVREKSAILDMQREFRCNI